MIWAAKVSMWARWAASPRPLRPCSCVLTRRYPIASAPVEGLFFSARVTVYEWPGAQCWCWDGSSSLEMGRTHVARATSARIEGSLINRLFHSVSPT
jgi:hypothetical protein